MFSTKLPRFRARMIIMAVGVFFVGFFMSFLVELRLGSDPFNTCFLGVAKVTGLSHGTTVVIVHSILFLLLLWRGRRFISFGTLANMICVGYISDFFRWVWSLTLPEGIFLVPSVRWTIVIPVVALFVIAAACYMAADVGVSPFDALPHIIVEAFPRLPFTAVRLTIDLACVLGGFLTGADVGIVTAVMAFFIAPILTAVRRFIEKKLALPAEKEAKA